MIRIALEKDCFRFHVQNGGKEPVEAERHTAGPSGPWVRDMVAWTRGLTQRLRRLLRAENLAVLLG